MDWVNYLVTIFCALAASTGFWGFVTHQADKREHERLEREKQAQSEREAQRKLLTGLAHDRIMWLGMQYINRGNITNDEYENLRTYLFEPYAAYGGNGSAAKVMRDVDKLPMTYPPKSYSSKKRSEC
jgi:hypothetical protein